MLLSLIITKLLSCTYSIILSLSLLMLLLTKEAHYIPPAKYYDCYSSGLSTTDCLERVSGRALEMESGCVSRREWQVVISGYWSVVSGWGWTKAVSGCTHLDNVSRSVDSVLWYSSSLTIHFLPLGPPPHTARPHLYLGIGAEAFLERAWPLRHGSAAWGSQNHSQNWWKEALIRWAPRTVSLFYGTQFYVLAFKCFYRLPFVYTNCV